MMRYSKWILEQAAKQVREELEGLRGANNGLRSSNESLREELTTMRQRVIDAAPQKQFLVKLRVGNHLFPLIVDSVSSAQGVTTIMVRS